MEDKGILDHVDGLSASRSAARHFTAYVFTWMAVGLGVTALVAWFVASSGLYTRMYSETGGMNMLGWVITLAPLAFILIMNFAMNKLSAIGLSIFFILFSAVMGASLSYVFLLYSIGSLTSVFLITTVTFVIMAIVGYTTDTDLTKFGSILMMGLIGIIIAMVINWFLGSAQLDYIISIIGVLIFTGLIAYDTQRIKDLGAAVGMDGHRSRKLAIIAATSIYLDFINLFLFLLRLLGRRD